MRREDALLTLVLLASCSGGAAERASITAGAARSGAPLPRVALLARLRGDRDVAYFLFDPARADAAWRPVLRDSRAKSLTTFLTPILGSSGIASSESIERVDLESGRVLETVFGSPTFMHWTSGRELRFMARDSLHRLDLTSGRVERAHEGLGRPRLLGPDHVLAIRGDGRERRVVLVNIAGGETTELALAPDRVTGKIMWPADGVYPAGELCRDGVWVRNGSELWFRPDGEDGRWRRFGELDTGATFDAAYLGGDRFAVALLREVGERESTELYLVNGLTGVILETERRDPGPIRSLVPASWWTENERPRTPVSRFALGESRRLVLYAGTMEVPLERNDRALESPDGRYLAIRRERRDFERVARVELLDADSGRRLPIAPPEPDAGTRSVDLQWLVLASEKPTDAEWTRISAMSRHGARPAWTHELIP